MQIPLLQLTKNAYVILAVWVIAMISIGIELRQPFLFLFLIFITLVVLAVLQGHGDATPTIAVT